MDKIKQAVIFAGGKGERLRPITNNIPKPLAPIHGRPFSDYLVQSLIDVGINKILFLVGYQYEKIISHYGKGSRNGITFDYSIGTEDDLTGKRLIDAYEKLDNHFLTVYGDNYWKIEMAYMLKTYSSKNTDALITVFGNKQGTGEYGFENNVTINSNSLVIDYDDTRTNPKLNGINIGYMLISKSSLPHMDRSNQSVENMYLRMLLNDRSLAAYITDQQYWWVTNKESLHKFESYCTKSKLIYWQP